MYIISVKIYIVYFRTKKISNVFFTEFFYNVS